MRNQRNYIFYDCETSNLIDNHPDGPGEVIEIAARALRYQDYELINCEPFYKIIKPKYPERLSPKALEKIGQEKWDKAMSEGCDAKVAYKQFAQFFKQHNPTGKYWTSPIRVGFNNNNFDDKLTEIWMKEYKVIGQKKDDTPWAVHLSLDLLGLLFPLFKKDDLPNLQLDTFLDMFGIPRSTNIHHALEDVDRSIILFQKYMRFADKMRLRMEIIKHESQTV